MPDNKLSRSSNNISQSDAKNSKKLNSRLYSLIAKEYQSMSKSKRTMDNLYKLMVDQHEGVLQGISKENFAVYFKDIQKKGFTISDLKDPKAQKNDRHLNAGHAEEDLINQAIAHIQKTTKKEHAGVFDDFVTSMKLRREGKRVVIKNNSLCTSITSLQDQRTSFADKQGVDEGLEKAISRHLGHIGIPGSSTDQTNKWVTYAAIQKIGQNLPTTKLQDKREELAPLPLDAFSPIQNLYQLQSELSAFLHQYRHDFSQQQRSGFQQLIISNGNIYDTVKQHTNRDDGVQGSFDKRGQKFQHMFNKLVTIQTLEQVEESKERVAEQVNGIHTLTQGLIPR